MAKYNNIKDLARKNTFVQFDQWETQTIISASNRFIYDFSNDRVSRFGNLALAGISLMGVPNWYGLPADYASYIDSTGRKSDYFSADFDNLVETIIPDKKTISVNEDAIIAINSAAINPIGAVKFPSYVDYFRAGYAEFTIKTNKKNCIIASASSEINKRNWKLEASTLGSDVAAGIELDAAYIGENIAATDLIHIDSPYFLADDFTSSVINFTIELVDGKIAIRYQDKYNLDKVDFLFIGNEDVADNQWHHIVVNFGRPGMLSGHGERLNKRNIEIWIDGNKDKEFDDIINKYNLFYPTFEYLFNSAINLYDNFINSVNIESNFDLHPYKTSSTGSDSILGMPADYYRGLNEYTRNDNFYETALTLDSVKATGFSGAIHTFAHGINTPLSKFEIQKRYSLWKEIIYSPTETFLVSASMENPSIFTNKKKALKLFWNNLVDSGSEGVELDNNFQVESYSVTHKIINSPTEVFNFDMSPSSNINIINDVRIAITDEIIILGPGRMTAWNTPEAYAGLGAGGSSKGSFNPKSILKLDTASSLVNYKLTGESIFVGTIADLTFSNIKLNAGERILLTGQSKTQENGVWIFNGLDQPLTRPVDAMPKNGYKNVIYVTEGIYSDRYWILENNIESFTESQRWSLLSSKDINNLPVSHIEDNYWKTFRGESRFIDLEEDLDIDKYDLIVFMNYPENNDQIFELFPSEPQLSVLKKYNEFLDSLKIVVANGSNLFVSSHKLATDLGIVKKFTKISQEIESGDGHSAEINPFQIGESAQRYFDTHRQNSYHLNVEIPGLTDKPTYLMSDFIHYIPENEYEHEEWHAKYINRPYGLQENDEFLIPSLSLTSFANNEKIPGYRNNAKTNKDIYVVAPSDLLYGTALTGLANNHYHGSEIAANEYDDYVTTIIIHNGQFLENYMINGKIFVNCVEDSFTMSREDYNKAVIQNVTINDPGETPNTVSWQYSTSRLDRKPKTINVKSLTSFGQTSPTFGGGGPLIQSQTNASNGMIRSITDYGNKNYESDLYPSVDEEIYQITEIPTLSMTWLGLQWLAE